MNTSSLALVDINNMYASCERIFQPQLQRQGSRSSVPMMGILLLARRR